MQLRFAGIEIRVAMRGKPTRYINPCGIKQTSGKNYNQKGTWAKAS